MADSGLWGPQTSILPAALQEYPDSSKTSVRPMCVRIKFAQMAISGPCNLKTKQICYTSDFLIAFGLGQNMDLYQLARESGPAVPELMAIPRHALTR